MATLDRSTATLVPTNTASPAIIVDPTAPHEVSCACGGSITARGEVELVGTPGESIAGWTLGYIQLMFVNTDYTRYRGARSADGSVRITQNTQRLCRDTDENDVDIWYDPVSQGVSASGRGTLVLPAGSVIPVGGRFRLTSNYRDAPGDSTASTVTNPLTGQPNFIHKVHWAFAFCCILTARDPSRNWTFLKHFYWNVRWEANFTRTAAGLPVMRAPADLLQLNVQRTVHSGSPDDARFSGREVDTSLPIANDVADAAARTHAARDWSES